VARPSLSLVLPEFAVLFANELNQALLADSVKTLIKKADFNHDPMGFYQHLVQLFSAEQLAETDIPMAKLRGGGDLSLCVDPCYLHPDRDKLLLFYRDLDLSLEEAQAFASFLQPLFDEMQATLQVQTTEHWLLRLNQPAQIAFSAKEGLHGQPVTDHLPKGNGADKWIRLWNEIQMLLFDCPLNQAREAAGKVPINSVWFWGNASFPQNWQSWSQVSGQDDVLQQLASLSRSAYFQQRQHFADTNGHTRLHIERFDADKDWQIQLENLSENWLKPAISTLQKWQLKELNLIVPEWGIYRLTPFSSWRFWL